MCVRHHARCWQYSGQRDRRGLQQDAYKRERATEVEEGMQNLPGLEDHVREKVGDTPASGGQYQVAEDVRCKAKGVLSS